MVKADLNKEFLLSTQHPIMGGFSKWPDGQSGNYVFDDNLVLTIVGHYSLRTGF